MAVAMASGSLKVCSSFKLFFYPHKSYTHHSFLSLAAIKGRLSPSVAVNIPRAASPTAVEDGSLKTDRVPTPKVIIDQDSDPNANVMEITFGDRLGALLDTMNSLKNLGLNVVKANVYLDSSDKHNKFAITKTLYFGQESSTQLAMGATFGAEPPTEIVDVDIATRIYVYDDGPDRSLLVVESADRPGLLVDLVKIIIDINITVQPGEFDTEGLLAKAKFHVSYRDKPISKPLKQVLANSLMYFLRRPTTEEASF